MSELSEAKLREEVLVPLFRAMGYDNVEVYHWGPMEQGKDIVMSKPDDLGAPEFYGVVAKRGNISGQASGSSSGAEVATQIRQCFNGELSHPRTGEPRKVRRCRVVASGRIPKEARQTVRNAIEGWQARFTRFIDGDELWGLVEEHLGPQTIPSRLNEIGQVFNGLHPEYRVISTVSGSGARFGLEVKEGVEDPTPLTGRIELEAPKTPEGKEGAKKLRRHHRTGASVTLSSDVIKEIEFPEPLQVLFGKIKDEDFELEIGARTADTEVITRLQLENDEEEGAALSPVVLRPTQIGSHEFTLSNVDQDAPWHVELLIRPRPGAKCNFDLTVSNEGESVGSALKAARFTRALARGGRLSIHVLESSAQLLQFEVPADQSAPEIPDGTIELLTKAQKVQDATGTPLRIPDRELTEDDFRGVYDAAQIVATGEQRLDMDNVESITAHFNPEGVRRAVESLTGDRAELFARGDHVIEVLGSEIHFGPKEIRWSSPPLPQEERRRLLELAEESDADEGIPVKIPLDEDSEMRIRYKDWEK